ncbi:hypothetical protein GCM10022627_12580 [Haloarcula argentinensis]|uniref:Nucleic acid-binding protein n=2 Tax=Haloarcula argentinensis TaxID=43776 RepID=A0A830FAF4_HALAR|nr:hypothetical protein GCM10009006_06800 [Haloarcula argentinensis]
MEPTTCHGGTGFVMLRREQLCVMPSNTSPRDDDHGCPKCGHTGTDVGNISTTAGGFSKMFDIQTNQFQVVTCTNCGYSELYRDTGSGRSDLADIFLG